MCWRRLMSLKTLITITGYIGITHLMVTFSNVSHENSCNNVNGNQHPAARGTSRKADGNPELKIILFWTSFYRDPYFGLGKLGQEPFLTRHCEMTNCFITDDRTLLINATAVIVHNRHRWGRSGDRKLFEKRDDVNQLFVYVGMESPRYTYMSHAVPESCTAMFNVTMTYRLDSDVPIPYGYVIRRNATSAGVRKGTLIARTDLANKTRDVAWLVSHARTASDRETYVKELKRFIQVDVYGKHDNQTCKHLRADQCMSMNAKRYKFYLSFENSICRDYVTKKYFRTLNYDIIPIVYGGANYRALGPPGSYVDISEFRSPRALARHLRYLSTNQSAYLEYFRWRSDYDIVYFNTTMAAVANGFCKLCQLVNTNYSKRYDNICDWWHNGTCGQTTFGHF